jgi:hypothetical protein
VNGRVASACAMPGLPRPPRAGPLLCWPAHETHGPTSLARNTKDGATSAGCRPGIGARAGGRAGSQGGGEFWGPPPGEPAQAASMVRSRRDPTPCSTPTPPPTHLAGALHGHLVLPLLDLLLCGGLRAVSAMSMTARAHGFRWNGSRYIHIATGRDAAAQKGHACTVHRRCSSAC